MKPAQILLGEEEKTVKTSREKKTLPITWEDTQQHDEKAEGKIVSTSGVICIFFYYK